MEVVLFVMCLINGAAVDLSVPAAVMAIMLCLIEVGLITLLEGGRLYFLITGIQQHMKDKSNTKVIPFNPAQ